MILVCFRILKIFLFTFHYVSQIFDRRKRSDREEGAEIDSHVHLQAPVQ